MTAAPFERFGFDVTSDASDAMTVPEELNLELETLYGFHWFQLKPLKRVFHQGGFNEYGPNMGQNQTYGQRMSRRGSDRVDHFLGPNKIKQLCSF